MKFVKNDIEITYLQGQLGRKVKTSPERLEANLKFIKQLGINNIKITRLRDGKELQGTHQKGK